MSTRTLIDLIPSVATSDGAGVRLLRSIGVGGRRLDPFLMLDEFGTDNPDDYIAGFPPHPHRGFETVTYVVQGEVEHRDSAGNHGIVGPGDVQWMTAGDGIVHSEMPSTRIQTEGGIVHGLQLWVNLPASLRRTAPSYQALPAGDLAKASGDGWIAHVVAGSMLGASGPARTHTPVGYARVTVQPGATVRIPAPTGHTALVYAFAGSATAGDRGERLAAQQLAVFEPTDGDIVLTGPARADTALDSIVLTGEPVNEPIARYGPFVMNTRSELVEAIDDYNAGRMGSIPATGTV